MKLCRMIKFLGFLILCSLFSNVLSADMSKYSELNNGRLSGSEAEKEMVNFSKDFYAQLNNRKPLYNLYERYVDKIGIQNIATFLEKDSPSCHGVAHGLGRLVGERVEELNISMGMCGSTCTYACLHGVFKVYFSKLGTDYGHHGGHAGHDQSMAKRTMGKEAMAKDTMVKKTMLKPKSVIFTKVELEKFSNDVNTACDNSDSIVKGFYKGNCAHGVGHAMGRLAQDTALATEYCKVFPGQDMQFYCETGVFMEYGDKLRSQLFVKKLKRSEKIQIALEYCGKESFYPSSCLRFVLARNKSLGHVSRFSYYCDKQKSKLKNHCYNALGFSSRTYIAKNPAEFPYVCATNDTNAKKACISGVVLMKKGQKYRKKIKLACENLDTNEDRLFCNGQLNQYYYKIDNEYLSHFLKFS